MLAFHVQPSEPPLNILGGHTASRASFNDRVTSDMDQLLSTGFSLMTERGYMSHERQHYGLHHRVRGTSLSTCLLAHYRYKESMQIDTLHDLVPATYSDL